MFVMFDLMEMTTLRKARAATTACFALNGFVMGMWIVHIPPVEQRTGVGHALLGWLLLLLGAGAFAGMRIAGPLTDRFGARLVVPAGAGLCSAAVVLPALAADAPSLGGALLLLGFGNGCLDVAMNTHAVQVERGYGRPVMSAFHAVFSMAASSPPWPEPSPSAPELPPPPPWAPQPSAASSSRSCSPPPSCPGNPQPPPRTLPPLPPAAGPRRASGCSPSWPSS